MRPARTLAASCLLCSAVLSAAAQAPAADDPEKLRAAAEAFDTGTNAFKQGRFEQAAVYFENAFRDAPRPEPLRMAIKARREAGHLARAATLCARADALYGDDPDTRKLTSKVLEEIGPSLFQLKVQCEPSCTLILDDRLVGDQPSASQVLYAEPGTHKIAAGWRGAPAESKVFVATAGGSSVIGFVAAHEPAPVIHIQAGAQPSADGQPAAPAHEPPHGLSPVFFLVGAGATAVLGAVTIWSGLDTRSNPGPDTVRRNCVGLGADCPEYQEGIAKERRTNTLLIGTAALGVASGVIALLTDWGSSRRASSRARVLPTVACTDGLTVGAVGRF